MEFNYKPDGDTIIQFMKSKAFVRGLQGPIGSGKSVGCVVTCLKEILEQEPSVDAKGKTGKRKFRLGIIRNTTPQLETTTVKTWLDWLPEEHFGKMRWRAPFKQVLHFGDVEGEVWFLALDREEDVRKLLSFEFTMIFINEARELPLSVVTAAISRVGRYPRIIDGGPTHPCVIMDTNAPPEDHWWAIMSGQSPVPDWMSEEDRLTMAKPANWEFFTQPPAVMDRVDEEGNLIGYDLNPNRENGKWTMPEYYTNLIQGQTREWIQNMLQNKVGRIFNGRPVYSGFKDKVHVSDMLKASSGHEIYVGVDFGLTPAAAFCQDVRGQARTIDELVAKDMGAKEFAKALSKKIAAEYPDYTIIMTGDPAGDQRAQTDETTPFEIFRSEGLSIQPAYTNDPVIRVGSIQTQMNTMVDGRAGYMISSHCKYLVDAKRGGYSYKKDGDGIDKHSIYSHVSDAEQYAFLRMGYGKKLVGRSTSARPQVQANTKANLFNRGGISGRKPRKASEILSHGRRS
jgi:hypothetical protein